MPIRVATYNLHAGVDGWGRPTGVVDAATRLDADVLFLQEAWRGVDVDLAEEIAERTGATATSVPLASGLRTTHGTGDARWQPRAAIVGGNRGLCVDSVRPLSAEGAAAWAARLGAERGELCLAVVTRLAVLDVQVLELRQLAKDRAHRRVIVATLAHPTGPLRAVGVHGSHLLHGSIGQYREIVEGLDALCAPGDAAVLGGDLNCWGPVARRLLRGWRQAARGRSWPSWRPHSQIDHLFVRGDVVVLGGTAVDARASDHRPVVATIEVRGAGRLS